jgi:iduronate 2-sulfatase
MTRREFLKGTGTALAAGPFLRFSGKPFAAQEDQRPNILLFIGDDLRPEFGCYDVAAVKTPNIDQLARQSMVFTRAYCPMSICNPSRLGLLTGRRPDTLRIWDNNVHFRRIHPQLTTLPQWFKDHGYECAKIGKVFHDTFPDPKSWSRPETQIPVKNIYMAEDTQARQKKRQDMALRSGMSQAWINAYLRGPATEAFDAPDASYWDGMAADAAIALLQELGRDKPFFLAIGFMKPHLPYVAPKRYWDLYDRDKIPMAKNNFLPKNTPRMAINSLTELACYEDFVRVPSPLEGRIEPAKARLLKHGYYACVSFIDAQIGRIMNALTDLKLRENTIVVLVGDHGYKLGEHGSWGKMTNFEVDTRSPLIISAPGLESGRGRTNALAEFPDVFPTLCELAGLPPTPYLEGTSLVPLFKNPGQPWKTAAFSQYARGFTYRFMGRALRTDRYRYIEWRERFDDHLEIAELYDHVSDPQEDVNIAGEPAQKELIQRLSAQLKAGWRAAVPK